jgi:hypothetical protein
MCGNVKSLQWITRCGVDAEWDSEEAPEHGSEDDGT